MHRPNMFKNKSKIAQNAYKTTFQVSLEVDFSPIIRE